MGKNSYSAGSGKTGCSPGGGCGKCGNTGRAGAAGHYSIGRMSSAYSGGSVDLFKSWREMRRDKGNGYEAGHKKLRPYERAGPLETAAYSAMAAVDYGGKHRASYSANAARGTDKGYGKPVKGDAYNANIINFADYRARMLDNAYRKTEGSGYQPNFEYSQAA